MSLIDGRKIGKEIRSYAKSLLSDIDGASLTSLQVGYNGPAKLFTERERKMCKLVGIDFYSQKLPGDAPKGMVKEEIKKLNEAEGVDGIMVQMPLPDHLEKERTKIMGTIAPEKDVDGLHPSNLGETFYKDEWKAKLYPCAPKGIMSIFEWEEVELKGKDVTIINHSPLFGRPLGQLLLSKGATVTNCHVYTKDLKKHTREADIIIPAVGSKDFELNGDYIKEGSVVIDAGMRFDGKLKGDVDYESVKEKASLYSENPGGTGPCTTSWITANTTIAAKKRLERSQ